MKKLWKHFSMSKRFLILQQRDKETNSVEVNDWLRDYINQAVKTNKKAL
jgi:hypothetical protein